VSESPDRGSCAYDKTELSSSSLEEPWHCPHDAVEGRERCAFHHSATERQEVGISEADVHARFEAALASGDPDRRAFVGATLPSLDFDHVDFDHDDQRPLDLRHAAIDGDFDASHARFEEALDLRDATVGAFRATDASFSDGLYCQRATFEGDVDCFGVAFTGDVVMFTEATFEAVVRFDEATFVNAAIFDDATFAEAATFLGTEFRGRSIDIDDKTSFDGATFEDVAQFNSTQFEATDFQRTEFRDAADFENVTATAAVTFDHARFESATNFDGVTFEDDVSFTAAEFDGETQFRGVTFDGGGTMLHDDADFTGAHFRDEVSFESGRIGAASFDDVSFDTEACFHEVSFRENVSFDATRFHGEALFDDATFAACATFVGVTFASLATFRGAEFSGSKNHNSASVTFDESTFEGDANFHHVSVTAATFWDVRFEGDVRFAESEFTEQIDVKIVAAEGDPVVDFTDAHLESGTIVQPDVGWVRYDLTKATIGEVVFTVDGSEDRALFDYLRFCDTRFEGFDFTAHANYLIGTDWKLHEFDEDGLDYEPTVEMTSTEIEKTYQRAKISASEEGNVEASGKFRFKRQQWARKNYRAIAFDADESLTTRIRNGQRVCENLFMGTTCGHGMRLYRIAAMFVFFPIFPALLYTFGGPTFRTGAGQVHPIADIATVGGLETFAANIHFSYITFLTIGYGNVVAEGRLGLVLVSSEAYASVVLGGLFIYVLVKRSEL
jgi:hypothetical protein